MNEGNTSGRSKVARLGALATAVAVLGVSLGACVPPAQAAGTGTGTGAHSTMTGKAHKGGKKGHKGGKKSKKNSGGSTTPPPK